MKDHPAISKMIFITAVLFCAAFLASCSQNAIDEGKGHIWRCFISPDAAEAGDERLFTSVCEDCGEIREYRAKPSTGLEYKEIDGGTLAVSGIGDCKDEFIYISSSLTDGKTVSSVADNAFNGNSKIKYVYIESGIEKVGDYAFVGCSSLLSVTLPGTVSEIGSYCFYECSSLYDVNVPEKVTQINDYCFGGCFTLREVGIKSGVLSLGNGAYSRCRSLKKIELPPTLTKIGAGCFENCEKLEGAELPGLSGILPTNAFAFCKSLKSFAAPPLVHTLSSGAFMGCTALETVYIGSGIINITVSSGESPFFLCDENKLVLYVESASLPLGFQDGYDICNYKATQDGGDGDALRAKTIFTLQ